MPAYRDEERKSWTANFRYTDWMGKQQRKVKRGFKTKKEALAYENSLKATVNANMDMTLENFVDVYFNDKKGDFKHRTERRKAFNSAQFKY